MSIISRLIRHVPVTWIRLSCAFISCVLSSSAKTRLARCIVSPSINDQLAFVVRHAGQDRVAVNCCYRSARVGHAHDDPDGYLRPARTVNLRPLRPLCRAGRSRTKVQARTVVPKVAFRVATGPARWHPRPPVVDDASAATAIAHRLPLCPINGFSGAVWRHPSRDQGPADAWRHSLRIKFTHAWLLGPREYCGPAFDGIRSITRIRRRTAKGIPIYYERNIVVRRRQKRANALQWNLTIMYSHGVALVA